MYKPEVKYDYYGNQARYASNVRPAITRTRKVKKHKTNPFAFLFQILFAFVVVMYIAPHYMDNVTRPLFLRAPKYPAVSADYNLVYHPTSSYLKNSTFLGVNSLKATETKKPKMQKHPCSRGINSSPAAMVSLVTL